MTAVDAEIPARYVESEISDREKSEEPLGVAPATPRGVFFDVEFIVPDRDTVILSVAKNLVGAVDQREILRYAQNDSVTPRMKVLRSE